MNKVKYVVTADNEIIIFGEAMNHSAFKSFNPISAGFISFGVNKQGNPSCICYGKSVSLQLESNTEQDTLLAKRRLNMMDYY
jgi:hypothetical protein